jgi:hypothetical protein
MGAASRDLPPQECAWAARVLAGHVESIVPLRARPGASAWLRRELRELEARALRPVEFAIRSYCETVSGGSTFTSDGCAWLKCSQPQLSRWAAVGAKADELMGATHKLPASGDSVTRIASLDDGAFNQAMDRIRPDMTQSDVRELLVSQKLLAFADDKLIPFTGRGLVIAHQAISALQQNATQDVASLAPESQRPDSVVREVLRRAGAAADRVDHRLGAAIAALAIRRGQIIATSSAIERVFCVSFRSSTPCARDTGLAIKPGAQP